MWYIETEEEPGRREQLLAAAVEHVAAHGISDLSLRQLAAALGTSHRMLVYHFGSKEGLLVAVVRAVEQRQRQALGELTADPDLPPLEQGRRLWQRLTDPALWPHERLFFEMYGQALQGRPHTTVLLDGIVDTWLEPLTKLNVRNGMPADVARSTARLSIAVTRGLLLDLLATGDRRAVDEAMERFIALVSSGT
ncbi:MAG TPA: TetR/AcrR family transcriptional regulator [Kribbellaceae bacterium]|nr:TetR/AcrR family transcriptional regulator [Kribbellaceae bacterium]